jgi:uncharacterized membrane protein
MPSLPLPWPDALALAVFTVLWLGYEPLVKRLARGRGALSRDMDVARSGWMRTMVGRVDTRLLDANLMGHTINSASFFASANLILIAAAAGALFGGSDTIRELASLDLTEPAPQWLFELRLGLVVLTLARGLLDFIWALRQMNYWLATLGALPEHLPAAEQARWAEALSELMNPALTSFSAGVRAYYFALAAAAWLLGPWPFLVASVAATVLLAWRSSRSKAALALRRVRALIDEESV